MLIHRGIKVRCLVRPFRNNLNWISNLPVEIVEGDLLHPDTIGSALKDVDYIIHIAGITKAKRKKEYADGNLVTTRNLLEIAAASGGLKKICYVSSLTAVGPSPTSLPFDEQTPCHPISPYGKSKFDAEQVCHEFASRLPIVIIRPPTVYGPRDKDILEVFRASKMGIQPSFGSTRKTLSLVYGPDLAEAIVESTISEKTAGKTYFVSDPQVYSQTRVFDIVATLVGRHAFRMRLPKSMVYAVAGAVQFISVFGSKPALLSLDKARDLVQDHWVCNPEAIRRDIGFVSKTTADEGLRLTYAWYKANNWI